MRYQIHTYFTMLLLLGSFSAFAQISMLDAQFFQNRYLANPAMAGIEGGLRVNLGYRNQWNDIPGSPVDQSFTMDYRKDRVGLGMSIINAKAGDLTHNKIYATYSYVLPLNDESARFHFGWNLGFQKIYFNSQNIVGDTNDQNILRFNDRRALVDGDFGFGLSLSKWTIDGAIYNVKNQLMKDNGEQSVGTDFNLFYMGTSYSFPQEEWGITTKLAYRKIKNFTDLVDLGLELRTSSNKLGFTGIYHSNKSATFGLSYLHKNTWQLLSMYNTAQNPIASYATGSFELALQIKLDKGRIKNK